MHTAGSSRQGMFITLIYCFSLIYELLIAFTKTNCKEEKINVIIFLIQG